MKKIVILLLSLLPIACQKRVNMSSSNQLILGAHAFFTNSLSIKSQPVNYRASQTRLPQWDLARVIPYQQGQAVLVPIVYPAPMLMKANFAGDQYFHINYLTQLLLYKKPDSTFDVRVITSFPDSNCFKFPTGSFTGLQFIEDWQGNPISKYLYTPSGIRKYNPTLSKTTTTATIVQVCYTISGSNYAPSDPDPNDVVEWTEPAGCNYEYLPDDTGGGGGGGGGGTGASPIPPVITGGGSGAGTGSTSTIVISPPPPNTIIANIQDYMKCFSNYGGNDHTYQVTICVDQPNPGTREAWHPSSTGTQGSSSGANPVDVGHVFLVMSENFSGYSIVRNVGFYPKTNVYPWSTSAQGQLNDDDGHTYNISLTVSVDNGQFFNILNYISQGNNTGYMYDLNTNNCTSFVLHALDAGNIYLPATVGSWENGGLGYDPGDLGEDIRNMPLSANITRNTTYNDHPNKYNCN